MGNVNREGPNGTTTYDQTGSYTFKDPYTGLSYDVPTWTEKVQLSPEQQSLYDKNTQSQINMADLASQQSGFLKDYMNKPVDLSNEAVEGRLFELGSKRLDPRFEREENAMRTNLINRGIREGAEAFSAAMSDFNQGKNDAYNSLLLSGRGQSVQEIMAQRNQPINEITALLSGSQVSMPQFTGGNVAQAPTTDVAGLINQNYNQKYGNYQNQMNQWNSTVGGLFGLGSAFLGNPSVKLSDERLKTDVEKIGKTDDGQNIYSYRYKGQGNSAPLQLGLMAQEVEKRNPDAVVEAGNGYKAVNYTKALKLGAK